MAVREHLDPSVREYVAHPVLAREYDSYFAGNALFDYDQEFLQERVVPGSTVLDLGTGTGRHLLPLARTGCRVTGIDLNPHMLDVAAKKIAGCGLSVNLVQADMLQLPIIQAPVFDALLLMFSTLGLVHGRERREAFLRSLRKRLKPDGRLIFHVHNDQYHLSPHHPVVNRLKDGLARWQDRLEEGDHIICNYRGILDLRLHSFTVQEIQALLGATGYTLLHLEGLNDERDGPCERTPIEKFSNGFFVIAGVGSGRP